MAALFENGGAVAYVNRVVAGPARLHELLGALPVLLEIRMGRERNCVLGIGIHANRLSWRLESAQIRLKEDS